MSIGTRIQQLRINNGLTQEKLAEMLNVSRQSISKWEMEQSLPEVDKIILMSKLFSVGTNEILLEEADMKKLRPQEVHLGSVYLIARDFEKSIYRNGEKISESKCYFNDIEQIHQYDNWLFLQIGGQLYVLRKRELKENSAFYSFMYKNPLKTKASAMPGKWRAISIILFVASLLSLNGALILVGAVSNANNLFIENMWLFFLMTPIPISSIILGFVLKSKGYKYKKNIVAGIIMTFFLCLYGSFTFMF